MRRKLINFDAFKQLENSSLSLAERELAEAEDILSHALGKSDLALHFFSEDTVVYRTANDTFIHATYSMDKDGLTLENIEELVIEEAGERQNARSVISRMIDELLEGNEMKAENLFNEYISLPVVRRVMNEGWKCKVKDKKKKKKEKTGDAKQRALVLEKGKKAHPGKKLLAVKENVLRQLNTISENVLGYVDYNRMGPVWDRVATKVDDKSNVVAVRVPTAHVRNEGKILSFNWKTLNHELSTKRCNCKKMKENLEFGKAVSNLKRQNSLSDQNGIQEALAEIIHRWPDLIYLTQTELSKIVGESLDNQDDKHYDDDVCNFLAEGILRTAYDSYKDRVEKVLRLARNSDCQEYECFGETVAVFYPQLDESTKLQMQAFYDLCSAVGEIANTARRTSDAALREDAEGYLRDLYAVCEGRIEPDLELAEEAAMWLKNLVETNLETSPWNPTNSVHTTISGDHPKMAQNAQHSYKPSADFEGGFSTAPVSDGKSYKGGMEDEMRNRSWGNMGEYPSISNPYVPKPFGDYTMKGETGVDKNSDSGLAQIQKDTWPSLTNPYVPKAETPQTYKMNHGKDADLVVDK